MTRLQAGPFLRVLLMSGHGELGTVGIRPKDSLGGGGKGQNPRHRVRVAVYGPDVWWPVLDRLLEAPPQSAQLNRDRARNLHAVGNPDLGRRSARGRVNACRAATADRGYEDDEYKGNRSDRRHRPSIQAGVAGHDPFFWGGSRPTTVAPESRRAKVAHGLVAPKRVVGPRVHERRRGPVRDHRHHRGGRG